MSTPDRDDLEQRLTELFAQRAATVTRAPSLSFIPEAGDRKAAPTRSAKSGVARGVLTQLAVAAVVFLAIAGTVLGGLALSARKLVNQHPNYQSGPSQSATPTAGPPCWVSAPAGWLQAIEAGAFAVDRRLNTVLSTNGATGDYLVAQGNAPADRTSEAYSDLKLTLYRGTRGSTIYTPAGPKDYPQADPTGAISADWVAFAVVHPDGADRRFEVMLYQRSTRTLRSLAGSADQPNPEHKLVRGAPVIAAGKVFWLAAVDNRAETMTLESWDLSRGSAAAPIDISPAGEPNSYASGLVGYGSGVAVVHESVSEASGITAILRNGAGEPLSAPQLSATAGGSSFGFDGADTLSWLRRQGDSVGYSALTVGGTGVRHVPLALPAGPAAGTSAGENVAVFPFTAAVVHYVDGLLDLRTGTPVALPIGEIVQAVVGDSVVFGTGSSYHGRAFGSAGLSLVPLSALPPAHC